MADTSDTVAFQRLITSLLLDEIGTAGFALAGSGAIREHGITDRPTHDIDLFTTTTTGPEAFAGAVTQAEQCLRDQGYQVTRTRSTPEFARLMIQVAHDSVLEVDFGIDWRGEPPTQLAVGPVLAVSDAVGSKVAAVYSRGEARDFLDLDSIRQSRRFTDADLLALAHEHDPGFDITYFSRQLTHISRISPDRTSDYGVDAARLDQIRERLLAWAGQLAEPAAERSSPTATTTGPDVEPDPGVIDAQARERLHHQERKSPRPWSDHSYSRRDGPQPPGL